MVNYETRPSHVDRISQQFQRQLTVYCSLHVRKNRVPVPGETSTGTSVEPLRFAWRVQCEPVLVRFSFLWLVEAVMASARLGHVVYHVVCHKHVTCVVERLQCRVGCPETGRRWDGEGFTGWTRQAPCPPGPGVREREAGRRRGGRREGRRWLHFKLCTYQAPRPPPS